MSQRDTENQKVSKLEIEIKVDESHGPFLTC